MSKQVELGDKLWFHYGQSVLIVGHIVDCSPNHQMIGVSPVPYDVYEKMTMEQRASCPISWCETRGCHYLCHIPRSDLRKQDEKITPKVGFNFIQ